MSCVLTLIIVLAHLSIQLQLPILHQAPKALPDFLKAVVLAQCNPVLQYSSCFLIWYPFCVLDFASAQQELCKSYLRGPLGTYRFLASCLMSAQEGAPRMPNIRWKGWYEPQVCICNQEIWHFWASVPPGNDLPWADQLRGKFLKERQWNRWFWVAW